MFKTSARITPLVRVVLPKEDFVVSVLLDSKVETAMKINLFGYSVIRY